MYIEDYISEIADNCDVSDRKAKLVVTGFIDCIINSVAKDGEILVGQLGKFKRHADYIEFKPSKNFRDSICCNE